MKSNIGEVRPAPHCPRLTPLRTQRGGIATLTLVWLVIIGAIYGVFFVWLAREENPNPQRLLQQQGLQGEVVLKRNRAGHYVADGEINGERVVFLLDTGATQVALPMQLARRLGLQLGPAVTVQTAAGPAPGYQTRLNSVRLASIEMRNVTALVSDGLDPDMVLLGMNFLKRLEMIQRDDQLILRTVNSKK
ncbi:MAG: TIGR02281 family clan AA aspartic protease [Pseudomonadota bacterium]